jgi:hemoglobin
MKLPLQPHFFERWLALWQETAGEVFAPEPAALFRHKAARIAESLKLGLFYRPGALPLARGVGAQS